VPSPEPPGISLVLQITDQGEPLFHLRNFKPMIKELNIFLMLLNAPFFNKYGIALGTAHMARLQYGKLLQQYLDISWLNLETLLKIQNSCNFEVDKKKSLCLMF